LLGQRWPGASPPPWGTDFGAREEERRAASDATPPFAEPASESHGLPYSDELARCYRLLDLPFGAPMPQVTRQWKAYLKKSHPDLHANDSARQADATVLTQQLNDAYKKIRLAWKRHQR
jgi:hypothetical protein